MPASGSCAAFTAHASRCARGGRGAATVPPPTCCSRPASPCGVPTPVEVVAAALLAHHAGAGHRTIAAELDVPHDTVRSWLRRIIARAEWLRHRATVWASQCDPDLAPITPTGSRLGDALEALGVAVSAHRRRLGTNATAWQLLAMIAGGRLLAPLRPASSG